MTTHYFLLTTVFLLLVSCGRRELSRSASSTLPAFEPYAGVPKVDARKLSPNSSLGQLMAFAVQRSPLLKTQYYLYLAARSRIAAVGQLPNPEIAYSWYARSVETRDGPQRHRISITQKIPWPSKLGIQKDVARRSMELAGTRFETLQSFLLYDLKKSWFNLWRIGAQKKVLEELKKTLVVMEGIANARYKAQRGSMAGILKLRLSREILSTKISRLESEGTVERARLNNILGVSGLHFVFPRALPVYGAFEEKQLRARMLRHNPLLEEQERRLVVQRAALERARLSGYPDFMFNIGYIETGSTDLPGAVHSGQDPVIFTVGIAIPLWRSAERAKREEQRAMMESASARKETIKLRLLSRLASVLAVLQNSRREVADYNTRLIPMARAALSLSLSGFIAGKGNLLTTFEVVRSVEDLRMGRIQALYREAVSVASLEQLCGATLIRATLIRTRDKKVTVSQ
ncbi:TolC family protein [Myxococcota bacterium]|nr:TolC family protein [Myxococcota bacterium]MBU1537057.1 TolC family protein [Myxococcota bacterium]